MINEPTENEPTEMAGAAEADTEAAHAWALDYDEHDDVPTHWLTPRRITALGVAASLATIAVAASMALVLPSRESSEPSAVPSVAAALDGTYRIDYDLMSNTIMGSPNPPPEGQPQTEPPVWRAFRSTCTPAGCTATSVALDGTNHEIAAATPVTRQWRFVDERWEMLPEKSRIPVERCVVDGNQTVKGDETIVGATSLEPRPDGSLRGTVTSTIVSSECGGQGTVYQQSYTATRVGDVPTGVIVTDPSTVDAQPPAPHTPMAGPVLNGTYRLDNDSPKTTYSDGSRSPSTAKDVNWSAFRSMCTAAGCVATEAELDDANHQEPTGLAGVFHFTDGHWVKTEKEVRIPLACDPNRPDGTTTEQTVQMTLDLVPQPDGKLTGTSTITWNSNECGNRGDVMTTPVVATRTGPVPPDAILADPALFAG